MTRLYLGIDSSSPYLALALWSESLLSDALLSEGLLASFYEEVGRDHARRLPDELGILFKRAGVQPLDLSAVGIGLGPGSYTGVRVGVAAAKGLAAGLGIALRGDSSLAAMACAQLSSRVPEAIIALDARRGNVYAGVFRFLAGEIALQGELLKVPRDDLRAQHPQLPYFENTPPDAGYLARRAALGANPAAPLYL